jgi:hypothetical protein
MANITCPPGLAKPSSGAVSAYLKEVLNLSTAELISVGIQLEVQLGATTLTAQTDYKVPADRDLVVFQVQSTYRSTALSTEPVLNANIALDYDGLESARLANCLAQLRIKDRNLDIFDNGEVVLSALKKAPMYWPQVSPLLVPAGVILQSIFTLQSAVAAVAGNNAFYGLLLTGVAIPKRV